MRILENNNVLGSNVRKAGWAFRSLRLCVTISLQGVWAIEPLPTEIPGQLSLWPDAVEPLPDLETVEPFGRILAQELGCAFTGQPFHPTVPWLTEGEDWYRDFYHQLLLLGPGQVTTLPETMSVGDEIVDRKAMATALRHCRLAPLVPLHRVALSEGTSPQFALGKYWKEFLLRQELMAQRKASIPAKIFPDLTPIAIPSQTPPSAAAKPQAGDPKKRWETPAEITLAEFIGQYLSTRGKSYRASTRKTYESTFRQARAFWSEGILLRQITPAIAYEFIATRTRIAPHGQGYSPASRNRHLRNAKAVFRMAKTWGYITENPFAHIRLEKTSPRRWHHLKPGEFQAILSCMEDLRWRVFYLLAYTTGARFGELFNLTWSDIDFQRGAVTIRSRTASPELPPFFVKDHEERVLFLPQSTLDALGAWRKVAPESVPYILLTAERWQRVWEKWSLCRAGKPWKYNRQTQQPEWAEWENRCMVNNVLRDIRSHARRAGINVTAPLTVHTLRKSFAQNHAHGGTPSATLKVLMGHASITTTEKYYLQNSDENTRAAVKRYEDLLREKTCR